MKTKSEKTNQPKARENQGADKSGKFVISDDATMTGYFKGTNKSLSLPSQIKIAIEITLV